MTSFFSLLTCWNFGSCFFFFFLSGTLVMTSCNFGKFIFSRAHMYVSYDTFCFVFVAPIIGVNTGARYLVYFLGGAKSMF